MPRNSGEMSTGLSGYHRRMGRCLAICVLLLAAGCDGEEGPCSDTRVSILDPMPGQRITASDDADPDQGGTQYVFVVEARCLMEDELVSMHVREPVETVYAGLDAVPGSDDVYRSAPVDLLPGTNVFVAITSVSMTESEEVEVTISP